MSHTLTHTHTHPHTHYSSDKVIKEVKSHLLCGKGNPGLNKVSDVNVICGVLKDFLRNLKEPILTFKMHGAFTRAAGEDVGFNSHILLTGLTKVTFQTRVTCF